MISRITALDLLLSQLVLGPLSRVSEVLEEDSLCSQSDKAEQGHPSVPPSQAYFLPPSLYHQGRGGEASFLALVRGYHGHTQYQATEMVGSNQPVFILSWCWDKLSLGMTLRSRPGRKETDSIMACLAEYLNIYILPTESKAE